MEIMMEKNKLNYRNVDIDDDLKRPTKIRTTIFLEQDLITKLKADADSKNIKYQQLLRNILFDYFLNERTDELKEIKKRLEELEKKVS